MRDTRFESHLNRLNYIRDGSRFSDPVPRGLALDGAASTYIDLALATDYLEDLRTSSFGFIAVFKPSSTNSGAEAIFSGETADGVGVSLERSGASTYDINWSGTDAVASSLTVTEDGYNVLATSFDYTSVHNSVDGGADVTETYATLDSVQSAVLRLGARADDGTASNWLGTMVFFAIVDYSAMNTPQGSNELANGDFANWTAGDPDNWVTQGEIVEEFPTVGGGKCRIYTPGGSLTGVGQALICTVGRRYHYSVEVTRNEGNGIKGENITPVNSFYIGGSVRGNKSVNTLTGNFTATGTTIWFNRHSGASDIIIDNLEVKECLPAAAFNTGLSEAITACIAQYGYSQTHIRKCVVDYDGGITGVCWYLNDLQNIQPIDLATGGVKAGWTNGSYNGGVTETEI
jgi:hypothetical protein